MKDPKLMALRCENVEHVRLMRKAEANLVDEYPTEKGVVCVFHKNPGESNLPVDGAERRALTRSVRIKKWAPEPRPEPKGVKEPAKAEKKEDEGDTSDEKSD